VSSFAKAWNVVPEQKQLRSFHPIPDAKQFHYKSAVEMAGDNVVESNAMPRQGNAIMLTC
jgi:hypothetical protein